ncbi:MAG TPA: GGDEF domain-containing protein [Rhizobacter sp.]|nr:GGDEF domain-containing protein [Rhizobacter sp.]
MPTLSATQIAFLMVACQQAVLALGWLVGAVAFKLDRRSVVQWAGYALLTGIALVLFVWATVTRSEEVRAVGNVCVAAGVMLMQRGVRQFVCRMSPTWVYLVLLAAVVVISWFGLAAQHGPLRVATISGLLGLLCWATARDVYVYVRHKLDQRWGLWLALPLLLGGGVFLVRSAWAMLSPATVVAEVTANSSLNISSAVVFMVTALVFHLTLVALVAASLMAELRRLSRHDALTELLNRRAIDELLRDEARRAVRSNRPFSVLMVDADYFKAINDRFGHAAGDEALRHLARILQAQMRDVDRVGRFGGEEFIVLLPGTASTEALSAAERLRDALLRRPWAWEGEMLRLTVSTGVAAWRGPSDEIGLLLKRADAALYRAKSLGRDRFEMDQ